MPAKPYKAHFGRLMLILLSLLFTAGGYRNTAAQSAELLYEFHPAKVPVRRLPFEAPARPSIGVVLSGGGSRAMVHIGVLTALEEAGLYPTFIVGVSAGAVIGGLYAAGFTPSELAILVGQIRWQDLFTDTTERINLFLAQKEERDTYALQIRFDGYKPILPTSYLTGQRVSSLFSDLTFKGDYLADGDFDGLEIPFRAVATDLLTGKRIVLSDGILSEALMATSAIPILLAAVPRGDQLLVDGGLVDAIPVSVAEEMGADIIIVSDVSAALRPASRLGNPLEIIDQVTSIMMQVPNASSLERADLVISPNIPDHLSTDFEGIDTLITVGYRTAREKLQQWEGRPEAGHLLRLAGVHEGHGPGFRVAGVDVEGGNEEQQARAGNLIERELIGRSVDETGLEVMAARLLEDGTLADVRLQVFSLPAGQPGQLRVISLNVILQSRPMLREILFEGAKLYDVPELRRAIGSTIDEPVDRVRAAGDIKALERYYRDRGYPLAIVREVRFDPVSGALTFEIDEGIIEEIRVEGLEITHEVVILRELPFAVGEPFGLNSIQETIDTIYGTGLFERVLIEPARSDNGGLAVVVRVEERSRHLYRFGLHYLEEQQTETFLEYRNENMLGLAGKLSLLGMTGSRRGALKVETRFDRLFRTFLTYQIRAGYYYDELFSYAGEDRIGMSRENTLHISATIGQQVHRLGQLSLGVKAEDVKVSTVEGIGLPDATHHIRGFELRSIVDTQDQTPFPRNGVRHEFIYETATDALNSDISYVRLLLSLEWFNTVGRHTFHPRFFFGSADNTLPPVRWFRLGGIDSFYGYYRDQVRGRQVLLISGEYIFRIPWRSISPLLLSFRYDWGGGWEDSLSLTMEDMIGGVGIKVTLDSPVGPLEMAYGLREGGYGKLYFGFGFHW